MNNYHLLFSCSTTVTVRELGVYPMPFYTERKEKNIAIVSFYSEEENDIAAVSFYSEEENDIAAVSFYNVRE